MIADNQCFSRIICFNIIESAGWISATSAAIAAAVVPAIILLVAGPFAPKVDNTPEAYAEHAGRRHALALFVCTFFVLVVTAYLMALLAGTQNLPHAGVLVVPVSALLDIGAAMLFNSIAWLLYDYEHRIEPQMVTAANRIAMTVMLVAVANTSLSLSDAFAYSKSTQEYPTLIWTVSAGAGALLIFGGYFLRLHKAEYGFGRTQRLITVSLVTTVASVLTFDVLSYFNVTAFEERMPGGAAFGIVSMAVLAHVGLAVFAYGLPRPTHA
jgi:hypothetical protein